MATVYVTVGSAGARGDDGPVSVLIGNRCASETITSSGTTAKGSLVAAGRQVGMVYCDTAVYAVSGPSATVTATAANGIYCPAGIQVAIAMSEGHSIAVIDV